MQAKYLISGKKRRELKKELNLLKAFHRNFWRHHQLEQDMFDFYGGRKIERTLAEKKYAELAAEIEKLEKLLLILDGKQQ